MQLELFHFDDSRTGHTVINNVLTHLLLDLFTPADFLTYPQRGVLILQSEYGQESITPFLIIPESRCWRDIERGLSLLDEMALTKSSGSVGLSITSLVALQNAQI